MNTTTPNRSAQSHRRRPRRLYEGLTAATARAHSLRCRTLVRGLRHRLGLRRLSLACLAAVSFGASSSIVAQSPAETAGGDANRGETLYTQTYKCYACHGFDAQTGQPRLVPMRYTEEGFVAFVQRSPLPQMPPYPDAPAEDLRDVYAYILSLPEDAPDVDSIPELRRIMENKLERLDE